MEPNDGGKDIMEARGGKDKEEPGLKKHEPLFKPLDRKQFRFSVGYFLVTLLMLFLINFLFLRPKVESIDYSAFKAKIESGEIHRVEMGEKYLTGFGLTKAQMEKYDKTRLSEKKKPAEVPKTYRTVRIDDPDLIRLMDTKGIEYYGVVPENNSWLGALLSWVLPIVLMVLVWNYLKQTDRQDPAGSDVVRREQGEARRRRRHGRHVQGRRGRR